VRAVQQPAAVVAEQRRARGARGQVEQRVAGDAVQQRERVAARQAQRRARGGECDWGTNGGSLVFPWDDPRSPFNGSHRETYFNQTTLNNAGGPTTWYTDPFGGNASRTPFTGSIAQRVASLTNTRPYPLESQAVGANRPYGGNGVHAPN